jgi:hypothetical protein
LHVGHAPIVIGMGGRPGLSTSAFDTMTTTTPGVEPMHQPCRGSPFFGLAAGFGVKALHVAQVGFIFAPTCGT